MSKTLNNKLILGTVQMGLPYGINNSNGQISLDDSLAILKYAFDSGIETLDSAEAYGNAHQAIGAFHSKYPTKRFKVITKLPNQTNENIITKVAGYLDELKVDQLYALLFHSFSSFKKGWGNFHALRKLKVDGKIKKIGVSVYTNAEVEEVMINEEIDIIQVPFNLFDNTNLRGDIFEKAKSKGKTIHTRSALLQGLFFRDINEQNPTVQSLKSELIHLSDISKAHNIPISRLALSYCLCQKNIENVLIGVDTLDQLKDNIESAAHQLQSALVEEINSIAIKNLDFLNPSLWK